MKTSKSITLIAAALTFAWVSAVNAAQPGMIQRAAANHFELPSANAPRNTSLPSIVAERKLAGGKHWAQMQEAYRPVANVRGVDIVHAPRPITASKDPDLERKWRANATEIQVAPLK